MSNANRWSYFVDYEPWHTLMRETRERRIEARANRWRAWATDRARDNTLEAHLEALLEYPR